MVEFHLIDLRSQMPYLPASMRTWPRERFLNWLHIYGNVRWFRNALWIDGKQVPIDEEYFFLSWVGRETVFSIRESGGELFLHIPGTSIRAWEQPSLSS